jgi:hypothetical protein
VTGKTSRTRSVMGSSIGPVGGSGVAGIEAGGSGVVLFL